MTEDIRKLERSVLACIVFYPIRSDRGFWTYNWVIYRIWYDWVSSIFATFVFSITRHIKILQKNCFFSNILKTIWRMQNVPLLFIHIKSTYSSKSSVCLHSLFLIYTDIFVKKKLLPNLVNNQIVEETVSWDVK